MPETLGKYELGRVLGSGMGGTVREAWDPDIRRSVAIKTVRRPDAGDAEAADMDARFRREAEAAGRLTHPNVVAIYDFGVASGVPYIVMELIDGESLKTRLDRKAEVPPPEIAGIMRDLLAGLQYSHERGVVHRDIKPANIMLTRDGRAKIADFGIARIGGSSLTLTGTVMGTPAYMSPEQISGETVDARSDIWSAGVVLYQLLTGERPYEGSPSAIMVKIMKTAPILPTEIRVTAPVAFDWVVRKALAKRPDERFASATAFATAVREAAAGRSLPEDADGSATVVAPRQPVVARPEVPPDRPVKSRVTLMVVATVAMALLLGVGAGFLLRGSPLPPPPVPPPAVTATAIPQPAPLTTVAAPERPVPTQATPPAPKPPPPAPAKELRDCPTCPELVLIPAGSFTMGVPPGEDEREKLPASFSDDARPQHKVTIANAFYMGKYTVTRAEFARFVDATGPRPVGGCYTYERASNGAFSFNQRDDRGWKNPGFPQTDRDPAVCVSAEDADAFAAWLSRETHQDYRLPSEAQWEYAARAGTTTARYWGDGRDDACLYANVADRTLVKAWNIAKPDPEQYFSCSDGFSFTAPVGSFRPNGFGLHDMLGNVWQWTADPWHGDYKGAPPDGSVWITNGDSGRRVLRGGSWGSNPGFVRAGVRSGSDRRSRNYVFGFRLSRTLSGP